MKNYCFLQNGEILSKTFFCHFFVNLKRWYPNCYKKIPSHVFFLLFTLFLNILYFFQSFVLPVFRAVFFSLSLFLEFLLISESYHGLSSSRATIVLFGIHSLANSIKTFAVISKGHFIDEQKLVYLPQVYCTDSTKIGTERVFSC